MYAIFYSRQAIKDKNSLEGSSLYEKAKALVCILKQNPFQTPPPYEKLQGDLKGLYSRRINRKHRMWYSVDANTKVVRIIRMWTHYE